MRRTARAVFGRRPASRSGAGLTWCVMFIMLLLTGPLLSGLLLASAAAATIRVDNTAPARGVKTIRLERVAVHGARDDDAVLFGIVNSVLFGPGDRLYALDSFQSVVQVFALTDSSLTHIETLDIEGEGPGEATGSPEMSWTADGCLRFPCYPEPTVAILAPDGSRADRIACPFLLTDPEAQASSAGAEIVAPVLSVRESGGNIVMLRQVVIINGERTHFKIGTYLTGCDGTGRQRTIYGKHVVEMPRPGAVRDPVENEKDYYFQYEGPWDVGRDGRVYAAWDYDDYRIAVYAADAVGDSRRPAEPERIITRVGFERSSRSREARQAIRREMEGAGVRVEVAPHDPAIAPDGGLVIDADGNLWVLHAGSFRDLPPGIMISYDLFSPDGEYLHRVDVGCRDCEGDWSDDNVYFDRGRFVVVKNIVSASRAGGRETAAPVFLESFRVVD